MVNDVLAMAERDFPQLKISRSRLYQWDAAYSHPADLWKLVDDRGGDRRHGASPEAWKMFEDLYCHQNQPSVMQCHQEVKRAAVEHGWTWCSYEACLHAKDKRISLEKQLFNRDPERWRTSSAPYTEQHKESWRPGELWIGDHKQLDLICRWKGELIRPWLTVWKDWRTRKVCGWVLSDNPNSTTILAALRHGLKDDSNLGGPDHVWIDNGKDYDAWLFHGQTKKQRHQKIKPSVNEPESTGLLAKLSIVPHFSLPYCPNGKSRLERWFGTLEGFCKTFPTYTGDSIETKPERLSEILADEKQIPTFETVYSRIGPHIAGFNASADHQMEDLAEDGLTLSPNEAFAKWCDRKRVLADPGALDLLMQHWHKPLTVGRNGITVTLCGRALHYGNTEQALVPFKASNVAARRTINISYDPHDLDTIRVYDEQFRFVCISPMNQVGGRGSGITKETVATAQRNKARYNRALQHVADHSITSVMTSEEQLAAVASEQQQTVATPSSFKPIRTPLDGQASEIARAEFRQAAGAECVTDQPLRNEYRSRLQANLKQFIQQRDDYE